MNRLSIGQIITFAIILVVQVLLLKSVQLQFLGRFTLSLFIYPVIIILLPVGFRRSVIIVSAFFLGLFIDMFYDSPGVHTAAFVFTGFIRAYILRIMEPRLGYRNNEPIEPSHYGLNWFMSYLALILFIHIFIYFSIDSFSYVFFTKIFVNTISSFAVSFLVIVLYKMLL